MRRHTFEQWNDVSQLQDKMPEIWQEMSQCPCRLQDHLFLHLSNDCIFQSPNVQISILISISHVLWLPPLSLGHTLQNLQLGQHLL